MKKLIEADSTRAKGELVCSKIIAQELARSGIESQITTWDQNRSNIIARVKSTAQKKPILIACHHDVVDPGQGQWKYPPFEATEIDGRIYGRGSMDMKGGIVASVSAIRQIVESGAELCGDIIFLAAAGEETDSCGTKKFMTDHGQELSNVAGVLIPEPTGFDIVIAHRGIFWLEVTTTGKTAHGAMPHLGINALSAMKAVLNELDDYKISCPQHELLGDCSMSINTIHADQGINVIPDKCTLGIDIRTLPDTDTDNILADFEKIFAQLKQKDPTFNASVNVYRQVAPLDTKQDCDFVKKFCSIVGTDRTAAIGYTTDGPHFAESGAAVIIFGPGKLELAHKPDEYIDICDLEKAVQYYKKIILGFAG